MMQYVKCRFSFLRRAFCNKVRVGAVVSKGGMFFLVDHERDQAQNSKFPYRQLVDNTLGYYVAIQSSRALRYEYVVMHHMRSTL